MTVERRALVVATVPGFFVHMHTVRDVLAQMGYVVEASSNFDEQNTEDFSQYAKCHNVCFARSPFSISNLRAFWQLHMILRNTPYDIVFCNTPVGGVLGRLAVKWSRAGGTRTIYMAHGFHFYMGAPLKNWIAYYPVEWLCSWLTDTLITITREDYSLAQRHFHAKRIAYVPGVGVNLSRFVGEGKCTGLREELGIPRAAPMLLSVGELNRNKNHQIVIRALCELEKHMHYVIAGEGVECSALKELAEELGVQERVHLLGRRHDVPRLMAAADVYVLPSHREGLNVSLMEAMASGLPCVCRRIRGNVDLIDDCSGGRLVTGETPREWAGAIDSALRLNKDEVKKHNLDKVSEFSCETVSRIMHGILKGMS